MSVTDEPTSRAEQSALSSDPPVVSLHCLPEKPPPQDVVQDARSAAKLTGSALEQLWTILEPCLSQPMTQELALQLSEYCLRHEVAEADLGRTIRASRFLLRQSSSVDLDIQWVAEDITRLFGDVPTLSKVLLTHYETAKQMVREELFLSALANHGAVLEDVDWRTDYVAATSNAPRLLIPVALLTFQYREGNSRERKTLQLTPALLHKLQRICHGLVRTAEKPPPAPR